ncbi:hypothetical protein ACP26L_11395 [Paenibacillus sp. S-38]|uniref:hypothetical protein n=1 Tax=Paenibacillus sp. S-38 TaxID=3416710 RepID=UPI003CF72143
MKETFMRSITERKKICPSADKEYILPGLEALRGAGQLFNALYLQGHDPANPLSLHCCRSRWRGCRRP